MSQSDRPSAPPLVTPPEGLLRPGLVYIDDSATALQSLRRAMHAQGILLETFSSVAAFTARGDRPLVGVLLDVDLGGDVTGAELAIALRAARPDVAIAFLTSETDPALLRTLALLGPVFSKGRDVHAAAGWLAAIARGVDVPAQRSG